MCALSHSCPCQSCSCRITCFESHTVSGYFLCDVSRWTLNPRSVNHSSVKWQTSHTHKDVLRLDGEHIFQFIKNMSHQNKFRLKKGFHDTSSLLHPTYFTFICIFLTWIQVLGEQFIHLFLLFETWRSPIDNQLFKLFLWPDRCFISSSPLKCY